MKNDRRNFLKCSAVVAAATAAGMSAPKQIKAQAQKAEAGWKWDKAVCRFCGTGCGPGPSPAGRPHSLISGTVLLGAPALQGTSVRRSRPI